MHERALFRDLMGKIDSVARTEGASGVAGIAVRLGPYSHLTPGHFREHFEWESRGTLAEGADVEVLPWPEARQAGSDGIVLERVELVVGE